MLGIVILLGYAIGVFWLAREMRHDLRVLDGGGWRKPNRGERIFLPLFWPLTVLGIIMDWLEQP